MNPQLNATHDPNLKSWLESANGHPDFPIQNLPYGIFAPKAPGASLAPGPAQEPRPGVAIGDRILDLKAASDAGILPTVCGKSLHEKTLNKFFELPSWDRQELRTKLSDLLSNPAYQTQIEPLLHRTADCDLFLPATISDYTDFYVGIHHAMNVGRQFRPDQPLLPNYKFVPIGYHGRASSVRPSGQDVTRPKGQQKPPDAEVPTFGPSKRLDYELEMAIWIGRGNPLGTSIPIGEAADHIAGFGLLNDWSARDLQAWEYQPLGPFLAKSFQTTVSPWVVTPEALAPFRIAQAPRPQGDPQPLPYLNDEKDQERGAFSIELQVSLRTEKMRQLGEAAFVLSRGPASNMYWTVAQLVTHHTSNGCNLQAGDLMGTGTISAPDRSGFGSLLEISAGGKEPVKLPNGETRTFLQDLDEVILTATANAPGKVSIGFGSCSAKILPAHG